MNLIALESSTALGGVALFKDGNLLSEESSLRQRSHSEFLNSALQKVLDSQRISLKEIDQFAVTVGPGSFTGIRVAGNLAKTLAYSLDKKIWVTDSLSVLASQISWDEPTLVGINAFKNMIYCSLYKNRSLLIGPTVIDIDAIEKGIDPFFKKDPFYFLGDGFSTIEPTLSDSLRSRFLLVPSLSEHPTATLLGTLFFQNPQAGKTIDWNSFLPLYLRGSEAEENLRLRASENS